MNRWPLILVLVLATIVTYARVLEGEFVSWDDPETIAANPLLNPPSAAGIAHYWRHAAGGLYIPVTYTYWSALAALSGGDASTREDAVVRARPFHVGSVLLHVIAVLLVFSLLRQVIAATDLAACVGAMLFALHPVQVESVAWASGAKDLLAGVLALTAIDQALRFIRARQSCARSGAWGLHYMLALVTFILAILSKPSAVVTPVIVLLLAWVRFRPPARLLLGATVPMLVLSLACVAWSRVAQPQFEATDTPLWTRPLIAADALAFYLRKLSWPAQLAILYGRTPNYVVDSGAIYYTWIFPALAFALVWRTARWTRWPLVGFVIFIVALSPVLGFARFMFQIHSTVADHYLYLPMFGIALAAAGLVALRPEPIVIGACAVLLVVLAVMSAAQIGHWRDSEALYSRALEVNPTSAFARGGLGRAHAQAGRIDEAIVHFRAAVELVPTSRIARTYLAQAYLVAGKYDRAVAEATAALRLAAPNEDTTWERHILDQALAGQQRPTTHPTTPKP